MAQSDAFPVEVRNGEKPQSIPLIADPLLDQIREGSYHGEEDYQRRYRGRPGEYVHLNQPEEGEHGHNSKQKQGAADQEFWLP